MARLKCPCGNVLNNVAVPNDVEGILIPKHVMDSRESVTISDMMEIGTKVWAGTSVWECDQCGRLAVGDDPVKWYAPDDGIPGGLMRRPRFSEQ